MIKLEALESCVNKWQDICDGRKTIQSSTVQCSLCELYYNEHYDEYDDYDGCDGCPLMTAGECCLRVGTIWDKINNGVKLLISSRNMYLSEVNNPELTALCHKMRDLLIRLRDEEKRSDSG